MHPNQQMGEIVYFESVLSICLFVCLQTDSTLAINSFFSKLSYSHTTYLSSFISPLDNNQNPYSPYFRIFVVYKYCSKYNAFQRFNIPFHKYLNEENQDMLGWRGDLVVNAHDYRPGGSRFVSSRIT